MVFKTQTESPSNFQLALQPEEKLQMTNFLENYRFLGLESDELLSMTLQEVLRASVAQREKQASLGQGGAAKFQLISESPGADPLTLADSKFLSPQSATMLGKLSLFIRNNYHLAISLDDVAQAIGYSSAYLTSQVRRLTGKTVCQWIVEYRMASARSLLLHTEQSVAQIAEAVGYSDVGYFFRKFRQYHNTTPGAWRVAHRTHQ
jgi:AraC-like DNA-binding protein